MSQKITPREHAAFAALFSRTFLSNVIDGAHRRPLRSLLKKTGLYRPDQALTSVLESAYAILDENYRCEYIYKNTLVNKIIFGRHNPAKAVAFSEFDAHGSKADLVIANGTTTAYEIKTALDSTMRLPSQMSSYSKVFDEVYVVTHQSLVDNVDRVTPSNVGILTLSDANRILTVRKANSNLQHLDTTAIFATLRRNEYLDVIEEEFGLIPIVPNTQVYAFCRDLFLQLPVERVHQHFVRILRERNRYSDLRDFISKAPASLRALYVTTPFSLRKARLLEAALMERV